MKTNIQQQIYLTYIYVEFHNLEHLEHRSQRAPGFMMYKGALKRFAFCHSRDFTFVQPLVILREPTESNTISFGHFYTTLN